MLGNLITLPLRVPVRSAQLLTRAAGEVAGRAVSITGDVIAVVSPGRSQNGYGPPPVHVPPVADAPTPPVVDTSLSPVVQAPVEWSEEPPAPLTEEPAHVSEEPELVQESAEPGAEDGAGAHVTVAEPWEGYSRMSARDVIDRAGGASVAELATMRLYEARHRARQTVLATVDRQLELANGGRLA
jgi:hypothetical protein